MELLLALIGERAAPVPSAEEVELAQGEPELEEVEEENYPVSSNIPSCLTCVELGVQCLYNEI